MNRWAERLLVRRILRGERTACEQLVHLHHASVYRLLVRLCRDAHFAEDLTQETFAAAWSALDTFNGSSSLATWLYRIAYRRFVDARRRQRPLAALREDLIEMAEAAPADPLQGMMAEEQSRRLYETLARLEARDREILVLHYLHGLTFRELAHVLEQPGGTVKWWTNQALDRLRTLLNCEKEHGNARAKSTRAPELPSVGGAPATPR